MLTQIFTCARVCDVLLCNGFNDVIYQIIMIALFNDFKFN